MSAGTEHTADYGGTAIEWDGDLEEGTIVEVTPPGGATEAMPLFQLIAMTNGDVLSVLDA
jgi:hypothetical protein